MTVLLPSGMRDLLPAETRARRQLARTFLAHVEAWGYALVVPPAFELADVLERGLGTLDVADTIRFPLPETGDIAALRPDMTPQLARMIATRLSDKPPPLRLAYEGTVLRRRRERARKHSQIAQAGVELAGPAGPLGDLEVLELATGALPALGIDDVMVDLGHGGVVRALLAPYARPHAEALLTALAAKDAANVERLARADDVPRAVSEAVAALIRLDGPVTLLDEARRVLEPTPAREPFLELATLIEALLARGVHGGIRLDLGETRGFAYYTGVSFRLYAEGPGEAIGGGGRYDDLLARFGRPMPAAGFAIDLDHVAWARRARSLADPEPLRLAAVGVPRDVVAALREAGVSVTESPDTDHARAWGHASLLTPSDGGLALVSLDAARPSCNAPTTGPQAIAAFVLRTLTQRDDQPT